MTRELLLMRHGKAGPAATGDDRARPLKDRGKRAAQRMGAHLARRGLVPDHILSSPALRAITSAEKSAKAMGLAGRVVTADERLYRAGTGELLAVLESCPAAVQRPMLVGHSPGLEDLIEYLCGAPVPRPAEGKRFATATLARLGLPEAGENLRGSARLVEIIRARDLPEQFPYPAPDGPGRRDRPAYYYEQSAVIPYRLVGGELQVLLVASSSGRHWVVPKGIRDPGLTPQASAAKEALEEAGVEGTVAEEALGNYRYPKWGAECAVAVYPMAVTRVLPVELWEERHRGREWLPLELAVARIHQGALRPLLRRLPALVGAAAPASEPGQRR